MSYIAGIDIGGTFTDCVFCSQDGDIFVSKAPTTHYNYAEGFMASIHAAAEQAGLSTQELLSQTELLAHATTIATNSVIESKGARVGLITTAGHKDAILFMRGHGRAAGISPERLLHIAGSGNPEPIVPRYRIEEVWERVDYRGQVVVPLDEVRARETVQRLLDQDVESIAISLLWSFRNPEHEQRIKKIVQELNPDIYVTCSSDVVPKIGEYERTTATVINAFVAPKVIGYLDKVQSKLRQEGYRYPLLMMLSSGGVVSPEAVKKVPFLTIGSGPVGGVVGSSYVAEKLGMKNVIATDVGGTSFDVGLIFDGRFLMREISTVNQYEYYSASADIKSIGTGGGSIAWVDSSSHSIRVGPNSAGSAPGPVCYGKGGIEPTVTDADLVLGYINPDYFIRGSMRLDKDAAEKAIAGLAEKVGLSLMETAAGIRKISDFQMADLIRQETVVRGFDPRDFVIFAYGGAGPVHASMYAKELGISKVVIPSGDVASGWSAFGAAASDIKHVYEKELLIKNPFDPETVLREICLLEETGEKELSREGVSGEKIVFRRYAHLRFKDQLHKIEVSLPNEDLSQQDLDEIEQAFLRKYELLFGKGTTLAGASLELVSVLVEANGMTAKPRETNHPLSDRIPPQATAPGRRVYWEEARDMLDTRVYWGDRLLSGNTFSGPAIVDLPNTCIVVSPSQRLYKDNLGNFVIELERS